MPTIPMTASASSDELTATAHGLLTGDEVLIAATTYPGGLAPATSYWVIRTDADTIQLAASQALANAGTYLDLTTDGSGVVALIGLPYLRPRTYAPGAQLQSADLNAVFDQIVAISSPPSILLPSVLSFVGDGSTAGGYRSAFSSIEGRINGLGPGARITSIDFRCRAPGGDGMGFYLNFHNADGSSSIAAVGAEGFTAGGIDVTYTMTIANGVVLPPDTAASVQVTGSVVDLNILYNAVVRSVRA